MKKILILLISLFLSSCTGETAAYQKMQDGFPNTQIFPIPDNPYHYIVLDSSKVYYVKMGAASGDFYNILTIK